MARHKNTEWNLTESPVTNNGYSPNTIKMALLMDIRDELQQLNRTFGCYNFQDIPRILRGIRRKLPTRRQRKKRTA